jgi:hypothetical protein
MLHQILLRAVRFTSAKFKQEWHPHLQMIACHAKTVLNMQPPNFEMRLC